VSRKSRFSIPSAWYFLLPTLLFLTVFVVLPFLYVIYLAFCTFDPFLGTTMWIGLENFRELFDGGRPIFWKSAINTLYYIVGTVPTRMVIALSLAVLVNRSMKGVAFVRASFYLPSIVSTVAISFVWLWMYDPVSGFFNGILQALGLSAQPWLTSPDTSMLSIIIMALWRNVGYCMVLFLAGLQGIPSHLYEAATIDGAEGWQKFRYVTLPLLKPTSLFVFYVSTLSAFRIFEEVFIMTRGGSEFAGGPNNSTVVMALEIYRTGFWYNEFGMASAMSLVLFAFMLVFSLLNAKSVWESIN